MDQSIPSTLKRNTLPLGHIRSTTRKSRPFTADLQQPPTELLTGFRFTVVLNLALVVAIFRVLLALGLGLVTGSRTAVEVRFTDIAPDIRDRFRSNS